MGLGFMRISMLLAIPSVFDNHISQHFLLRTSLNSWSYDTAKRFYSEMDQARRWCKFFSKKHLTCPLFERTNFPNVHGSQYPLDYQWGAAKMREMLEITPAKGDKELLESDFKKWDYRDYPLAGVASAEEEAAAV